MKYLILLLCVRFVFANINFLGKQYSFEEWSAIQHRVDCLSKSGKWIYKGPMQYQKTCHNKGNCPGAMNTSGNHYVWSVKDICPFDTFDYDSTKLCDILNGQNVMIVGDSMHDLFSISFVEAFGDQGLVCNIHKMIKNHHEVKCKNSATFKVSYIRSDLLHTYSINDYFDGSNNCSFHRQLNILECSYFDKLEGVTLLIMNRGAHFAPSDVLVSEIKHDLTNIYQRYPNISILWRNTPHGHITHEKTFNDAPLEFPSPPPNVFNYDKFHEQNEIVSHMLYKYFPQVLQLDFYTSTVLRMDTHVDPVHYCIPGPTTTWVENLFYNTMRLVAK